MMRASRALDRWSFISSEKRLGMAMPANERHRIRLHRVGQSGVHLLSVIGAD